MAYTPVDQLPPQLAAELARQYDVLRLLGRGGMGSVWLARERSLERMVAIKVLAGETVEAPNIRDRFRREARIAARLVHPNIVPLHAFGETPDALYFVMGYVEGETLADRLEREGRIPRADATRMLSEIADALAFAHREGVVHRDVKPENILLDRRSGRAMLADFGVARVETAGSSVTMTGVAVGTPMYMSPEQALGLRDIDGRSDLYSLGVVGYRMLAGRLPFTGDSGRALMTQHASQRPADLAMVVGPADQELARVIMRALEKDPAARWARGEDMSAELEAAGTAGVTLPERLQQVQSLGTKLAGATAAVGGIFLTSMLWNERWMRSPDTTLPVVIAMGIFPAIIGVIAATRAREFGWRETLRAMFNPPASWSHWWPKALRRKDDIWSTLPKPLRRLRNIIDGVVTWLVSDIALFIVLATTGGGVVGDWFLAALRSMPDVLVPFTFGAPKMAAIGWLVYEYYRTKKKLGLDSHELAELLKSPHLAGDGAWAKPKFAKLLAGTSDASAVASGPRAPKSAEDLAREIAALSNRLRSGGLLPDGDSATAARSVQMAIQVLDDEIRRLASEIDPAEIERVKRRLATVGADDDLRRLLDSQLELLDRLQQRLEEKQARRERLHDQLVTLWMQLFDLDARLTRGAPADPELTGQVRSLIDEVARAGDALSEVEKLTAPIERVTTPV